jgi:hypothetical protein
MATPNPLAPLKAPGQRSGCIPDQARESAGRYRLDAPRSGQGTDAGELTADSFDDTYIDDPNADWTATGQGQKSAGDTSLPWPGNPANRDKFRWCSGLKTA